MWRAQIIYRRRRRVTKSDAHMFYSILEFLLVNYRTSLPNILLNLCISRPRSFQVCLLQRINKLTRKLANTPYVPQACCFFRTLIYMVSVLGPIIFTFYSILDLKTAVKAVTYLHPKYTNENRNDISQCSHDIDAESYWSFRFIVSGVLA